MYRELHCILYCLYEREIEMSDRDEPGSCFSEEIN